MVALVFVCVVSLCSPVCADSVTVREETITLPTYPAGAPEPNPMFYFGRQSQGAQGRIYPYPLYDSLTHKQTNQTYRIVYLENEYVRVGVLPEIGGRLFEAVDKSNGYNWVYRQHVVKPALIGLIGAWMSGGIEWNIPHHHRATTFLPVQYRLETNADGGATVWVGEMEVRHRMNWAVGYTLSPGSSVLTAQVRIINRTPVSHTLLCFANVAVHAEDAYQIIFPPDTQFVTHHAKREFATWPIATGHYSGADFGSGTDVSWFTNHINANSMFAWNYTSDFFAGYDHGQRAGTMSVADHHLVPGKKFWTWGSGSSGRMWDKILTDNDGPYIELMTGAYSDNQPDYSWLEPFETKSFDMHWYPFRDIGGVKNANLDAAVNLEVTTNGTSKVARVGFYSTAAHRSAKALLKAGEKVLLDETFAINPGQPFVKEVSLPAGSAEHELRAALNAEGRELIAYSAIRIKPAALPEVVLKPSAPKDIKTVEELYLVGQRIEQFHDAGHDPESYWNEALKRDPADARVNTALGIRRLKEARFADAETHFRTALARLTKDHTSPKDGEPFYYLGVTLAAQGEFDTAFDAFYKATWSEAWRGPAYFSLAEIATRRRDFPAALDFVNRSLNANALNLRALTLKAALLRSVSRVSEVPAVLAAAGRIDPLDVGVLNELALAGDSRAGAALTRALRDFPAAGLEAATEYSNAGLWQDGTALLQQLIATTKDKSRVSPLAYYYLGQFAEELGQMPEATEYRALAAQLPPDYVFPFQWEVIHPLRRAMELNPKDARAPYYLGNLLYDWQPDEATQLWEQSAKLDPSFAIVHRNLAIAYEHRHPADTAKAVTELEAAVAAPVKYAQHFAELDELYARTGKPPAQRLALLEQNQQVVARRDDSLSREIGLLVFAGKYDDAIRLMTGRTFSIWEGGTLDVADHWVHAHLLRGRRELAAKDFTAALADFQAAESIPDNLPSDRGNARKRSSELAYWTGVAQEAGGQSDDARQSWQRAVSAASERPDRSAKPASVSLRDVQIYYQALAERQLGRNAKTETALKKLLAAAQLALKPESDGANSPADANQQSVQRDREAQAHFIAGLAHLGLGDTESARTEFERALASAPDCLGANIELADLP